MGFESGHRFPLPVRRDISGTSSEADSTSITTTTAVTCRTVHIARRATSPKTKMSAEFVSRRAV
jgi:hypothetical protein